MSTSRIKDWTSKRAHFRLVTQSILWRDFVTIRVQGMHISDTHLYWCLSWQWHVYFRKFKNLKTKRNKRLSRSGEANVAPPPKNSLKYSKHLWFVLTNQPLLNAEYYRRAEEYVPPFNWPFSSYQVPQFQNESWCKTFHTKMSLIYLKINMWTEHIFIWMDWHEESFWQRARI